jgi:hypothetical protein
MIVQLFLVPILKKLDDVCFGPINGMLFSFLDTTQESRRCNKFENIVNACSSSVIIKLIKNTKVL